jgi:putative tryptophan/tyrosine transport system substrate-binding protein
LDRRTFLGTLTGSLLVPLGAEMPQGAERIRQIGVRGHGAGPGSPGPFVLGDPALFRVRGQIADVALRHRLPSFSRYREGADVGRLLAHGVSLSGELRHAAQYVDKILKGGEPGDLPVEEPTTFEKRLDLTIPSSLLARADQVIE